VGPGRWPTGELWLAVFVQVDRVLHGYFVTFTARCPSIRETDEYPVELPYAPNVAPTDGRHLHDLPVYKLDAVVLREDAGLAHLVVLLDGEAVPLDLLRPHDSRHVSTSRKIVCFRPSRSVTTGCEGIVRNREEKAA
jgi:hypothetical protein